MRANRNALALPARRPRTARANPLWHTRHRANAGRFTAGLILVIFTSVAACSLLPANAFAGTYYWDSNGTASGGGSTPSGTWGMSSFWTLSSAGTTATSLYTTSGTDNLDFIANPGAASGENAYGVTVTGSQSAGGLYFQSSGAASFSGTIINLGSGGITVPEFAYATVPQGAVTISPQVNLQAAQTWTNNSSNVLTAANVANGGNTLIIAGPGQTTIQGTVSGSGGLSVINNGSLTLTGGNTFTGNIVLNGGALTVASTGSLLASAGNTIYVGNSGPASMTIQDGAAVAANELDVNFEATAAGSPSTLTITGGSLHVAGQTYIGRASMLTDPSITSAAVYQSGGTATLAGLTTVGYNGTATSLYSINGGVLNAQGGLLVGGNAGNNNSGQGNGVVDINGSGVVAVSGSSGLQIGQDSKLTSSGSVDLASGLLSVTGNITLGSGGGSGYLSRSGGSMSVTGGLIVAGNGTLMLDATSGSVATTFGGRLSHTGQGTLVVIPYTNNLSSSEAVGFGLAPALSNGILGPWAVVTASGTDSSGFYLTAGTAVSGMAGNYGLARATSVGFSGTVGSPGWGSAAAVVSATGASTLTTSTSAYAVNFGQFATTIASTAALTITSGGLIVNGGTVAGGSLVLASSRSITLPGTIYAGSSTRGVITSSIQTSDGLLKFGAGTLVLNGSNTGLSGAIAVNAGGLSLQGPLALSGSNTWVTVAAGATLDMQGNTAIQGVPVTLNGTGGGGGSLCNVAGNNSLSGNVTLQSNSLVNVSAGTLTLSGEIYGISNLTKSGSGTLVVSGYNQNALQGSVIIAGGVVVAGNSDAFGYGTGTIVENGGSLVLQSGIDLLASVPVTLAGSGFGGSAMGGSGLGGCGAVHVLSGGATISGPVTLAAEAQVNIDAAADTLTISGNIGGGFGLAKGGAGTLLLSGSNSFSGALSVLSGTLSVASINNAGSAGPLGLGGQPIVLGSSIGPGTFFYTGSTATTNRTFTMAAGTLANSGGIFATGGNLTLGGVIGGNGGLTMAGSGILTLGGGNVYTGPTTVSGGTLVIGGGGSIFVSSGIYLNQGGVLQVTSSGANPVPPTGNFTFSGGVFNDAANGSLSPGTYAGALALVSGQSQVVLSNAGTGTPFLSFSSGAGRALGATLGLAASGSVIEFQAAPPVMTNGILPYAFVGPANSTTVDFATLSASSGSAVVSAVMYSGSTSGNLGGLIYSGTPNYSVLNVAASGSTQSTLLIPQSYNSLKLEGPLGLTMNTVAGLTLESGGLISTGGSNTISGGTLGSATGELIIDTATNLSVASIVSASSALTKTGTAMLTLTSSNPIAGNMFVNQGTLNFAPTANLTYGGSIQGAGNVLLSASGEVVTFSGTDGYTGSTTVSGGTLRVNGMLTGGGPFSIQNGAVLSGVGHIVGNVSLASGVLTLGQEGTGRLSLDGGLSMLGSSSLVAAGTGTGITGNLTYSSSTSSTYAGTIAGPSSCVTLNSPGSTVLELSGSNTYGGGTVVSSGVLKITNSAALSAGGLSMSGGTLDLNGSPDLGIAGLSGSGGVITDSGSGAAALMVSPASGAATASGVSIRNGNGVVSLEMPISADGTLILSGSSTFTGGTTVLSGMLELASPAALPPGSSVTVGQGAGSLFGPAEFGGPAISAGEVAERGGGPVAVPEPGTILLLLAALWSAAVRSSVFRRLSTERPRRPRVGGAMTDRLEAWSRVFRDFGFRRPALRAGRRKPKSRGVL